MDEQAQIESRLKTVREYVAKPIPTQPWKDEMPCLVPFAGDDRNISSDGRAGIIIGGARHAANPTLLSSMGCRAVLNCASGGMWMAEMPAYILPEPNSVRFSRYRAAAD